MTTQLPAQNRRLTLAIERLADDRDFLAAFRRDPARVLRRYRLDADEIEIVKSGDAGALAAAGVDVRGFLAGKRHGVRPWIRRILAAIAMAAGVVGLGVAPASAARKSPRYGVRRANLRTDGRLGARLGRSSIRKGLNTAVRAGARHSPRQGVRNGLRHSGLGARLGSVGVDIDEPVLEEPCSPCLDDSSNGAPFELGTAE